MALKSGLIVRQSQTFKLGHVVDILQMTTAELAEHVARSARDNPLLSVSGNRGQLRISSTATDVIEETAGAATESLYAHVARELVGLLSQGGLLERVVVALVEELEPSGWLARPVEDLATEMQLSVSTLETALTVVQKSVEPAGLFARDLTECLRLQLEEKGQYEGALAKVVDNIKVLETDGLDGLVRAVDLSRAEVSDCLSVLAMLDPKPGSRFTFDATLGREPDVIVREGEDGWIIEFPARLDIDVIGRPKGAAVFSGEFRAAYSQAQTLKNALEMRATALEKVVGVIVVRQSEFFERGPSALVPMTLTEVADETGFHLSTVSRILNGLLIEGPGGIVAARSLFVKAASANAGPPKPKVVARLRQMIMNEVPGLPLSDQRLSEVLTKEGMCVSRRVVAKYRQEANIPAAVHRRRLLNA